MGISPAQQLSENPAITLLHLRHFPGDDDAFLSRIPPETAGVYAWYQSFNFRTDPEQFYDDLIQCIRAKRWADRSTTLAPSSKITIESVPSIPDAKHELLKSAIKDPDFRKHITEALSLNVYFQSPLYIGRARDLRVRIRQHLNDGSDLRVRLESVKIDLRTCTILFMPLPDSPRTESETDSGREWEILFEEIFSRLFEPRFTIRYG